MTKEKLEQLREDYFLHHAEVEPRREGDHRIAVEINNAVKTFDWFAAKLEKAEKEAYEKGERENERKWKKVIDSSLRVKGI